MRKYVERFAYYGPNLPGLAHGTVFKGGIPPTVQDKIKENPLIKEAIIPLRQLGKTLAALRDGTSAEAAIYAALKGVTQ